MKTVMIMSVFAFASVQAFAASKIEAGSYSVDPSHSKVVFDVPHLVISSVEGRFEQTKGEIEMGKKIEDTKINADIDVNSVKTGNEDRDQHLKGADFFNAEKHPTIRFVSKKVTGTPNNLKVIGDLTIRGVTKPVTLTGKYLGVVLNDGFGNTKIAFEAQGKINRKDYGLTWNKMMESGPVVGDEVQLNLKVEAGKPLAKK